MPSPGSARGAEMNWRIPHRRAGAYLVDGSVGSPSLACASSIFKPARGWMEGLFRVHILRPSSRFGTRLSRPGLRQRGQQFFLKKESSCKQS